MARSRSLVALLLAALALQLAAAQVAGDAGITEYRPATRLPDPTPAVPTPAPPAPGTLQPTAEATGSTVDAPSTERTTSGTPTGDVPVASSTDDERTRAPGSPAPDSVADPGTGGEPTPSDQPSALTSPPAAGQELTGNTDNVSSGATQVLAPSPARQPDTSAPAERTAQPSQVAPRTGAGALAAALALAFLGLCGASLIAVGLRWAHPQRHPRR